MKLRSILPFIVLFGAMRFAHADDPMWWTARGVKNASPESNLSPATIGQAKHMAAMALAELETQLSTNEFLALKADVDAVANLTTPQTQVEFDNQRMVLLTGQLKALAKPFYDKIRTLDPTWLDNEMVLANIRVVEPGSNPIVYSPYPWSVATSDDQNKGVATLGQLKAVFSLRFEIIDSDHDGLPDAWERLYFSNLDQMAAGDPDGDGLSNEREQELGWNPSVSDSSVDTDSDGMSDAWELCYFPNLDQTPGGDPDGDGLTNAMEFPILSNPNNPDTDGDGMGDGYEEYYELSVNSPENIPAPGPEPVPGPGPDNDQDNDGKTNRDEWDGGSIPISPGEQPKFTYPPSTLKWFGVSGKVYFVEWTTDFNTWNTFPSEQLGTNHEITFLPTTGIFFRLKIYLDANEDTDADGLPDWREIEKLGTDPEKMDSDHDGLTDDEEVQRGTDPNNPNSDDDDLDDGEDADPRDKAINWKPASEPGYAFLEIEGWDQIEHGDPVMTNKKGQVLCQKAVWEAGNWTKLSGAWTGMTSPPVIVTNTWKSGPASEAQSIELYSAQATSIDDNGAIAGYASGVSWRSYQGNLPLAWDSADDASPVALGVPDVIVDDPSNYDEDDVAHVNRDGVNALIPSVTIIHEAPIHTMRRYLASSPLVATATSPSNLRCYGNSANGRSSRDGTCTGITYGDNQPWVWRGSGVHEIISGSNTDVPLYYPNFAQAPINFSGEIGCIGTTPPTGESDNGTEHPAIILGGSVLIHNGAQWVKSKSLEGATALSKSGAALTYEDADPAVWRNNKVAKLKDLCPGLEDQNITEFTPIDINDQGVILIKYEAPPPASNDIFRIGLIVPVNLDVNGDGDLDDAFDGLATYLPGYKLDETTHLPEAMLHAGGSFKDVQYAGPQEMKLIIPGLGTGAVDSATFRILNPTSYSGFCGNAGLEGDALNPDKDFSFSGTSYLDEIQGTIEQDRILAPIFCKDYGAWCEVEITLKNNGTTLGAPIKVTLPLDHNGDKIADVWQVSQARQWNEQFNLSDGEANWIDPADSDTWEPVFGFLGAELADSDGDGTNGGPMPAMADKGDDLPPINEYRGYFLDGGPDTTTSDHRRLSVSRKDLLVECSEMEGIASTTLRLPPGDSFIDQGNDPNAFAQGYTLNTIMSQVSSFFAKEGLPTGSNPKYYPGAVIDTWWVKDALNDMGYVVYENGAMGATHKYSGPYTDKQKNNAERNGWLSIASNEVLRIQDPPTHREIYGGGEGVAVLAHYNNRNAQCRDFIKLALQARKGFVGNDGEFYTKVNEAAREQDERGEPERPTYQGSAVFVNSLSEEQGMTNQAGFMALLEYSVAHELAHLVIGNDGNHFGGNNNVLSVNGGTSLPTSFVQDEITNTKLRQRASINRDSNGKPQP